MSIRPLHDKVLVRRDELKEEKTKSGIIIPDIARTPLTRGVVVAVGSGVALVGDFAEVVKNCDDHGIGWRVGDQEGSGTRRSLLVRAGDRVLFTKWQETEIEHDGEKLVAMKEDDILAVIEEL